MSFVTTLPGSAERATPRSQSGAAALFATLRLWRSRARERAELARFSERELRDIGISHSDALQEINKPFWRP